MLGLLHQLQIIVKTRIYLRVEQEAAWSRNWGCCGGTCYRHGDSLADQAVTLPFNLFAAAAHYCPLGNAWPTPLVMGL